MGALRRGRHAVRAVEHRSTRTTSSPSAASCSPIALPMKPAEPVTDLAGRVARAAGVHPRPRRAPGVAGRRPRRGRPRRLRAPDPAAGRDRRRARADAPARDARHRAPAGRRRARRGAHRRALAEHEVESRLRPVRRRRGGRRARVRRRRTRGAPRPTLDRLLRDAGVGRSWPRARGCCARSSTPPTALDPVELAESALRRARQAGRTVRAAASRVAPRGRAAARFHEARCALEAAAIANGTAPDVASYRDLGAFQLLLSLQDDEALRLYCDSVLGPLEDGGGEYGDELIRSLEAFIEQNGQWEKAARELFCHRHTLRYRIRRVEELTGRDLESARDRIEFWLALRARELVRVKVGVLGAGGHHRARRSCATSPSPTRSASSCCSTSTASARRPCADAHGGDEGAAAQVVDARAGLADVARRRRRARELGQLPREPRRDARVPRGRLPLHRPRRALPPDRRPARARRRVRATPACSRCSAWAPPRARRT